MHKFKYITYAEAVNEALDLSLKKDPNYYVMVLEYQIQKKFLIQQKSTKKYSSERVFDIPCSENALTVAIGCAIKKCRVVMTHQRLDFSSSLDQIIIMHQNLLYV